MLSKMLIAAATVASLSTLSLADGRTDMSDRGVSSGWVAIQSPVARGITLVRPVNVDRGYALTGEARERKIVEYQMAGSRRVIPVVVRE